MKKKEEITVTQSKTVRSVTVDREYNVHEVKVSSNVVRKLIIDHLLSSNKIPELGDINLLSVEPNIDWRGETYDGFSVSVYIESE